MHEFHRKLLNGDIQLQEVCLSFLQTVHSSDYATNSMKEARTFCLRGSKKPIPSKDDQRTSKRSSEKIVEKKEKKRKNVQRESYHCTSTGNYLILIWIPWTRYPSFGSFVIAIGQYRVPRGNAKGATKKRTTTERRARCTGEKIPVEEGPRTVLPRTSHPWFPPALEPLNHSVVQRFDGPAVLNRPIPPPEALLSVLGVHARFHLAIGENRR